MTSQVNGFLKPIESKEPPYDIIIVKERCSCCNRLKKVKKIDCNCNQIKWINSAGYVHCHYCGNWRGFGCMCGCGK